MQWSIVAARFSVCQLPRRPSASSRAARKSSGRSTALAWLVGATGPRPSAVASPAGAPPSAVEAVAAALTPPSAVGALVAPPSAVGAVGVVFAPPSDVAAVGVGSGLPSGVAVGEVFPPPSDVSADAPVPVRRPAPPSFPLPCMLPLVGSRPERSSGNFRKSFSGTLALCTMTVKAWLSDPFPRPRANPDRSRAMAASRRGVPTVADVAALAGVSAGTVSKAMNGRGQLRAATRERVLAAAKELGFQPNALARGLLEGRTYTVGVLTTESFGRFTIPIMLGVEDALGAGEISTLLCD